MRLIALLLLSIALANEYSVIYDRNSNSMEVVPGDRKDGVVYAYYVDEIPKNGWATLKLKANKNFKAEIQAEAMGFVEGVLTSFRIEQHYGNIYSINHKNQTAPHPDIVDFLKKQIEFINSKTENPPEGEEEYWRYIRLMMLQIKGLQSGYNSSVDPKKQLSFQELFMLNADGDMGTLLDKFTPKDRDWLNGIDCSALVRRLDNGDILFAHNTWRNYAALLRIYKFYEFFYDEESIRISFAASPGYINSKDDFYVTSRGLAIMETTNAVFDRTLFKYVVPQTVPSFIRSQICNFVAYTPPDWIQCVKKYNSGTYNNQWIVADLDAGHQKKDILWILEQIPGYTQEMDVTDILLKTGYWGSFNIPFFSDIYMKSGYPDQPYSIDIDYFRSARFRMFKRDAPNVESVDDMKKIMLYNNYLKDPIADGNPKRTISGRYDLLEDKPRLHGGVDSKVTSTNLNRHNMGVFIQSGPSTNGCPPFKWSEWHKKHEAPLHEGHPDELNFGYVYREF